MLTKKKGYSLVELMLALLLGSVLLAMVIGLYVTSVSSGAKSLKYSRLRTDLQSIMSMMEADVRRAGYGGGDFLVGNGGTKVVDSLTSGSSSCLIYSYEDDNESHAAPTYRKGFRLSNNEIQYGSNDVTPIDPLVANCYSAVGGWEGLSDKNFIKITELIFTESVVPTAAASIRSVAIHLSGELAADSNYKHTINTRVQVRNIEF
ncbi:pilus assembly protein PilW [Psychromonas sp. MB-3u-54]|uniref:prepilin-type N-terminal cleavage/methylation domain-containing protein n=1 Tax=Psychromonas sp. MB-3u-54 TaxID=2058319 RepID=UPI000C34CDAD|nr:prepilin-type N-terminal cleavage/methylation domain-containing protein [Psychromonas sp. MB-3u-54]PKH03536.1 pilus assembly protein PilW [Psychromonas sp. MB-3u-54]